MYVLGIKFIFIPSIRYPPPIHPQLLLLELYIVSCGGRCFFVHRLLSIHPSSQQQLHRHRHSTTPTRYQGPPRVISIYLTSSSSSPTSTHPPHHTCIYVLAAASSSADVCGLHGIRRHGSHHHPASTAQNMKPLCDARRPQRHQLGWWVVRRRRRRREIAA